MDLIQNRSIIAFICNDSIAAAAAGRYLHEKYRFKRFKYIDGPHFEKFLLSELSYVDNICVSDVPSCKYSHLKKVGVSIIRLKGPGDYSDLFYSERSCAVVYKTMNEMAERIIIALNELFKNRHVRSDIVIDEKYLFRGDNDELINSIHDTLLVISNSTKCILIMSEGLKNLLYDKINEYDVRIKHAMAKLMDLEIKRGIKSKEQAHIDFKSARKSDIEKNNQNLENYKKAVIRLNKLITDCIYCGKFEEKYKEDNFKLYGLIRHQLYGEYTRLSEVLRNINSKIESIDSNIESIDSNIESIDPNIESIDSKMESLCLVEISSHMEISDEPGKRKYPDTSIESVTEYISSIPNDANPRFELPSGMQIKTTPSTEEGETSAAVDIIVKDFTTICDGMETIEDPENSNVFFRASLNYFSSHGEFFSLGTLGNIRNNGESIRPSRPTPRHLLY